MIRRFRSDREDPLGDIARRREQRRNRRWRPKIVSQLPGENAPEAMWRQGGSRGIVRVVSCGVTVLMRSWCRGLNRATRGRSTRARVSVVNRMVKAGQRRGIGDRRQRTRCAHEESLQEEHASRGKSDDATEDVLPECSRYHDNPVRLPFEAHGVSGAPRPKEMIPFRYDNQPSRRNLATRQPECDVQPTGARLETVPKEP
jgi:hypothetical protein